jgi:hypothetical protein
MDNPIMIVLVIVVFALVVIAAYQHYRKRVKVKIHGPAGTGLELEASDESATPAPGVKVTDAKSRGGGLTAKDETGRGVEVSKVEVERDITATSAPPKSDPKV